MEPLKDIVKWDRYGIREAEGGGFLFGWILREDNFYDFVVVSFQLEGTSLMVGYYTSSAKHSKEIAKRLGCGEGDYLECRSAKELVDDDSQLIRWQVPPQTHISRLLQPPRKKDLGGP